MKANEHKRMALYHGVNVEVVQMMDYCSLIRYAKREFVVETADIVLIRTAQRAG